MLSHSGLILSSVGYQRTHALCPDQLLLRINMALKSEKVDE